MADIYGNLWLCTDCTIAKENDDFTGIDAEVIKSILSQLEGADISANFDSETGSGIQEFATKWCDGCGRYITDTFHRYYDWR